MIDKRKILLVDDEPAILQSLVRTFRNEYEVFTATSGQEALGLIAEHDIPIIVTDQRMPAMTGVELLTAVQRQAPLTIGIVLTGYADLQAVVDAINVGSVFRYRAKPWDLEELRQDLRAGGARYDIERQRIADLERLNTLLEHEVALRTAEVRAQNIRLSEMGKLRSRFLANVSHQLRTPLTITHVNLEMLEVCAPEKRPTYLRRALDGQYQLEQIVRSVLDFVDLDLAEGELQPVPLSINQLVGETVLARQTLAGDRQLHLVWQPAVPDLSVVIDEELVRKALDGVVLNALTYTPQGGRIEVSVSHRPLDGRPGWAAIHVHDTGPGISQQELQHLFEPLVRGQEQGSGHTVGIGLGLPLAAHILRWHGGTIEVQSAPGAGSTFCLLLPLPVPAGDPLDG